MKNYDIKKLKNELKDKLKDNFLKMFPEIKEDEIDEEGYLTSMNPEDNLLPNVTNWNDIKSKIGKGQGNELKVKKDGRMKFCALHSSAALCVNNFATVKQNMNNISFLEYSNFTKTKFEKKILTGMKGGQPNLDFYLENSKVIIGIESKFIEYLDKTDPTNKTLSKYLKLSFLPQGFDSVIHNYLNCTNKMYLDVAQLIKHSIGLINNKGNKDAILVYIYWQPKSWNINGTYQKIHEQHKAEIEDFAKKISSFITFKYLSYSELWDNHNEYGISKDDIKLIKAKYDIELQ